MANDNKIKGFTHERIETNNFLMIVLIVLVIAVGGLVEIVPLFFQKSTTQPVEGLKPYSALQIATANTSLTPVPHWFGTIRPSGPKPKAKPISANSAIPPINFLRFKPLSPRAEPVGSHIAPAIATARLPPLDPLRRMAYSPRPGRRHRAMTINLGPIR